MQFTYNNDIYTDDFIKLNETLLHSASRTTLPEFLPQGVKSLVEALCLRGFKILFLVYEQPLRPFRDGRCAKGLVCYRRNDNIVFHVRDVKKDTYEVALHLSALRNQVMGLILTEKQLFDLSRINPCLPMLVNAAYMANADLYVQNEFGYDRVQYINFQLNAMLKERIRCQKMEYDFTIAALFLRLHLLKPQFSYSKLKTVRDVSPHAAELCGRNIKIINILGVLNTPEKISAFTVYWIKYFNNRSQREKLRLVQ